MFHLTTQDCTTQCGRGQLGSKHFTWCCALFWLSFFFFLNLSYLVSCFLQVESIVLSIISMLSSPNDESPANVDAAVGVYNYLFVHEHVPLFSPSFFS